MTWKPSMLFIIEAMSSPIETKTKDISAMNRSAMATEIAAELADRQYAEDHYYY